MENDLISRSALLNIVEPRLDYLRDKNGPYDHYTDGYEECYDRIDEAPAVDAVEAVRCEDCKFCKKHPTAEGYKLCTNNKWNDEYYPFTEVDRFCSYGERRSE